MLYFEYGTPTVIDFVKENVVRTELIRNVYQSGTDISDEEIVKTVDYSQLKGLLNFLNEEWSLISKKESTYVSNDMQVLFVL